jgi:hypothetical protein
VVCTAWLVLLFGSLTLMAQTSTGILDRALLLHQSVCGPFGIRAQMVEYPQRYHCLMRLVRSRPAWLRSTPRQARHLDEMACVWRAAEARDMGSLSPAPQHDKLMLAPR